MALLFPGFNNLPPTSRAEAQLACATARFTKLPQQHFYLATPAAASFSILARAWGRLEWWKKYCFNYAHAQTFATTLNPQPPYSTRLCESPQQLWINDH